MFACSKIRNREQNPNLCAITGAHQKGSSVQPTVMISLILNADDSHIYLWTHAHVHKHGDATGGVQGPHSIPWIPEEPKGRGMTSESDQRNVLTSGHFLVRGDLKIVKKNVFFLLLLTCWLKTSLFFFKETINFKLTVLCNLLLLDLSETCNRRLSHHVLKSSTLFSHLTRLNVL